MNVSFFQQLFVFSRRKDSNKQIGEINSISVKQSRREPQNKNINISYGHNRTISRLTEINSRVSLGKSGVTANSRAGRRSCIFSYLDSHLRNREEQTSCFTTSLMCSLVSRRNLTQKQLHRFKLSTMIHFYVYLALLRTSVKLDRYEYLKLAFHNVIWQ